MRRTTALSNLQSDQRSTLSKERVMLGQHYPNRERPQANPQRDRLSMGLNSASLWRHSDFMRLWSGQTHSVFGSVIGSAAMSFTAILFLHATPFQMGVLYAMQTLPGFLASLFAGAWVDRLPRRPLLIGSDLGRALVLSSIPLAAWSGFLQIHQVYIVALLVSILTSIFDVAYESCLDWSGRETLWKVTASSPPAPRSPNSVVSASLVGWCRR
jgi:hypothetical protein